MNTFSRRTAINEADRRTDEKAELLKKALEFEQKRHGEAMRSLQDRLRELEQERDHRMK